MKQITDRLHRVTGQMSGVEEAIIENKDCSEIIPQLLAIKGAVNGIVQTYMEMALDGCVDMADEEKMRQLIKVLLKHS